MGKLKKGKWETQKKWGNSKKICREIKPKHLSFPILQEAEGTKPDGTKFSTNKSL